MGKLGKESLVRWSSINEVVNGKRTKIWRSKTFMYMGAIALILGGSIIYEWREGVYASKI